MMTRVRIKTRRKDIAPTLGNLGTTEALLNDDVAAFKVANFSVKVHFHFHKKKEEKKKKRKKQEECRTNPLDRG